MYKASVNEYQIAFDNALNSIIREIASSQAKDRLDEWKRTEFSTDSDGIIERVAGAKFDSKWTDTWRNTVNPAIQQVSNITYGSENLLLNSESRSDGANTTTHSFIRYYLTRPLETGKTYTLKASVLTTDERQSGQISVYPYP